MEPVSATQVAVGSAFARKMDGSEPVSAFEFALRCCRRDGRITWANALASMAARAYLGRKLNNYK